MFEYWLWNITDLTLSPCLTAEAAIATPTTKKIFTIIFKISAFRLVAVRRWIWTKSKLLWLLLLFRVTWMIFLSRGENCFRLCLSSFTYAAPCMLTGDYRARSWLKIPRRFYLFTHSLMRNKLFSWSFFDFKTFVSILVTRFRTGFS